MADASTTDQSETKNLLKALVSSQRQLVSSTKQYQEYNDKIRKTDREQQEGLRKDLRLLTQNVQVIAKTGIENKQDMNHINKQLDNIHDTLIIHDREIGEVQKAVATKNGKLIATGAIATIIFTASLTWWLSKGKPQQDQIEAMRATEDGIAKIVEIMEQTYISDQDDQP